MLSICEQFKSIQGESTYAGLACSFIRLAGCNLHCSYCDTTYAAEPGTQLSLDAVCSVADGHGCKLVEVTGGEPLLQEEAPALCRRLLDKGYTVLVETNGSLDIGRLPLECVRIVDVKCPGSGAAGSFRMDNLNALTARDQVKFVVSGRVDFDWALDFVRTKSLPGRCELLFSPAQGLVSARDLAEWILAANAPVRLGLQLHRCIWGEDARGR
jgi:7-carboxy-7-deazaguanine synthase